MSSFSADDIDGRARAWTTALESDSSPAKRAADLYAGDHWKVVLKIPAVAHSELDVKLWVASAGYGLVSIDTPLKPYSATFIRGHAESVTAGATGFGSADWWKRLAEWHPSGTGPRTIRDLATELDEGAGFILLALSAQYANALLDDIRAATQAARGRVGLISVGLDEVDATDSLAAAVLPAEARLKQLVGGAMQGVNARIAHRAVMNHATWFPDVDRLRAMMTGWLADTDPLPTFNRDRMTDEEVRLFIQAGVESEPPTSKSKLLRRLRDSGSACEQARFGKLYLDVCATVRSKLSDGLEVK